VRPRKSWGTIGAPDSARLTKSLHHGLPSPAADAIPRPKETRLIHCDGIEDAASNRPGLDNRLDQQEGCLHIRLRARQKRHRKDLDVGKPFGARDVRRFKDLRTRITDLSMAISTMLSRRTFYRRTIAGLEGFSHEILRK
jgi:hypothetical protein